MKLFPFCSLILFFSLCGMPVWGQTSSKIKRLQNQKKEIQKGLSRKQNELRDNRQNVNQKLRDIEMLSNQVENRQRYIDDMLYQIKGMDSLIARQQQVIESTAKDLERQKAAYVRALRYARVSKTVHSPFLFVLSATSVTKMYRRSRYAREYARYERRLAEQIIEKQNKLLAEKNELLKTKNEKGKLMAECEAQKALLVEQKEAEKRNVAGLKQRQKALLKDVEAQKRQLTELDRKIDQMIAWEVEQARKRAEEERRRREEKARKEAAAKSKNKSRPDSRHEQKTNKKPAAEKNWISSEERVLNGSFEKNKGRLPVPITGRYMLGSRFGTYNVPGLRGVMLDNKGTNYIGQAGARARSIFDGEVTAIFQFGATKNVLVRHGSYISVYCNLSSVIVSRGQKVKARDILGTVEQDGSGNSVLHFQLRKEKTKLNPEVWIGR